MWDENIYPFPNFCGATIEYWECISDYILHFTMQVITFPCWDLDWYVLAKKVSNIGFITVHGLNEGHIAPC